MSMIGRQISAIFHGTDNGFVFARLESRGKDSPIRAGLKFIKRCHLTLKGSGSPGRTRRARFYSAVDYTDHERDTTAHEWSSLRRQRNSSEDTDIDTETILSEILYTTKDNVFMDDSEQEDEVLLYKSRPRRNAVYEVESDERIGLRKILEFYIQVKTVRGYGFL